MRNLYVGKEFKNLDYAFAAWLKGLMFDWVRAGDANEIKIRIRLADQTGYLLQAYITEPAHIMDFMKKISNGCIGVTDALLNLDTPFELCDDEIEED